MKKLEQAINLDEVRRAKEAVYRHIVPTQLTRYENLSRLLDANIYVKHENHNPTGTFKVRGGVNLMHHLKKRDVEGVITFSTGNHGLSIATTAAWYGIDATVVVPENNNASKNRKIRETGAELIEAGKTFEESSETVKSILAERNLYYAHPANEPALINGVGTEFLEIIEKLPDMDALIIPIGAGSEAAAAVTVLKSINPKLDIYAVQAECSSAAYLSWKSGVIESAANTTFAGGFATGIGYEIPFEIYKDNLKDFILLTESEIYQGIAMAGYYTQNLLEGAGASTISAAIKLKDELRGKNVVLQFSGCNASSQEIDTAYALPAFRVGYSGV
ncbi:MAG: threonine ammonia-lyase [Gammaproteobacteria bacterium]|jgi:threonine dehydratase|nr:threonine ammonia-lyase [Gammaproteobacteria bacterium]HJN94753.1 pyridoxal-phosphate dependent enzyme [Gammaproteobacteria bacterium]|tara:strand:- start:6982 stop:7977 length:996 start_codon:yes stop_codon:yes gene_type:complete